jgi:hypothetical protein
VSLPNDEIAGREVERAAQRGERAQVDAVRVPARQTLNGGAAKARAPGQLSAGQAAVAQPVR